MAGKLFISSTILLLLFWAHGALAQNSLSGTARVDSLNKWSNNFCETDSAKACRYADSALALSARLKYFIGFSRAYNNKGIVYDVTGNYDSALYYYNKAVYYGKVAKNDRCAAAAYNNIGLVYWNKGELEKSMSYYFQSLPLFEKMDDKKGTADCMSNLALLYDELNDFLTALKYHFKALEIRKQIKDEYGQGVSYTNIGNVYDRLERTDSAFYFHLQGLKLKTKLNDVYGMGISLNDIGGLYMQKEEYAEARRYFTRALEIRIKLHDKLGTITTYRNISGMYVLQKKYDLALGYLMKVRDLSEELNSRVKLMKIYKQISEVYIYKNDYKKAFQYRVLSDSFSRLIYHEESLEQMRVVETRYETVKKEKAITLLNKKSIQQQLQIRKEKDKNRTIVFTTGMLLLVAGSGGWLLYNRKKASQEKKAFQSILDAEQKERIRIARDLHDSIGQMLSVVKMQLSGAQYNASAGEKMQYGDTLELVDKTITEVRNISHNLIPEELNFGLVSALNAMADEVNATGNTKLVVDVAEEVAAQQISRQLELSLYRIVQEVVGNMLKHSSASKIMLSMQLNDHSILIGMADNGKGFDPAIITASKGLGWKNIMARVSLLNGKMTIASERISGTQIQIAIPQ